MAKQRKQRRKQPNLQEYTFAMKVAYGTPQRDAYLEVFTIDPQGKPLDVNTMTPKEINALDARASRLVAREDIATLITDEQKLKGQRISASERKMAEEIRQNLGASVLAAQSKGMTLNPATLKGAELFLKSTGQFAPEEHILKNGGTVPGAFIPKGLEGMNEADLKKIAGIGGDVIDVKTETEGAAE